MRSLTVLIAMGHARSVYHVNAKPDSAHVFEEAGIGDGRGLGVRDVGGSLGDAACEDEGHLDAEGRPTEDPQAALGGTLVPIGGPKGYGLALVVDILAGALTGSDFGTDIASVHELHRQTSVGFTVQALDVTAFADWGDFERDMRSLTQRIIGSPRAVGVNRIYLPGEIEWLKKQERLRAGIPVAHSLLAQLTELAEELGVSLDFLLAPSQ